MTSLDFIDSFNDFNDIMLKTNIVKDLARFKVIGKSLSATDGNEKGGLLRPLVTIVA